jgi:hypothetical protein
MLLNKYLLNSKRRKVEVLVSPLLWITEQNNNTEYITPSQKGLYRALLLIFINIDKIGIKPLHLGIQNHYNGEKWNGVGESGK